MKRFTKGILISLILAFLFVISAPILESQYDLTIVPSTYAQEEEDNESTEENKSMKDVLLEIGEVPTETPVTAKNSEDFMSTIARTARLTHRLFAPFINYFSFQIGNFLGIDYIYSGPMGDMLHKIWVISRNLVNISFVFILLWLALQTIFSPEFGIDELKKKLLTFALLLVAVNFSWLGTKVVLDAANVVTHAVFAIPSGISNPPTADCRINTSDPTKPYTGSCYPTTIIAPANSTATAPLYWEDKEGNDDACAEIKERYSGKSDSAYTSENELNPDASESNKSLQGRASYCMENLNLVKYDQNTAVIYLTYGMARIQSLVTSVESADPDDLAVGVLLSLVIQLAYTVALLALFIALIARMAMLWFFVAFSPFMILVIWFKGKDDIDSGEGFKFGYNEFINYAFAPAYVGAIFAVTFIMISAGQSVGEMTGTLFDNVNAKSGVAVQILEIKSLFGSIGSLQSFIWLLMSLVVLWMGTFAMISKISIVKNITDKIKTAGVEAATMVGKAPYWAPILPLGQGGEKASVKSLWDTVSPFQNLQRKYDAANGGGDSVRQTKSFQSNLKKSNVTNELRRIAKLLEKPNAKLSENEAKGIARQLGFSSPKELLEMNKQSFVDGINNVQGLPSGFGDKLHSEISDALKPSTAPTPNPEVSPPPPTNNAPKDNG